jgi:hypothetical protein
VTYTGLEVRDQPGIPYFKIVKNGLFQKLAKTLLGQDILMGNPEMDEKFRFICEDESRFVKALDADMQQLILHLHRKLQAPIEMKIGVVNYTFVNHIHTDARREDCVKVMVLMLKIVKAMCP